MTSNIRNPLLLPEIARHVASLCPFREGRDWAYTCKTLFNASIPIIWESLNNDEHLLKLIPGVRITKEPDPSEKGKVINLEHLLKLIPGVRITKEPDPSEKGKVINLLLVERALTENWTRYWHYAPFVKHLILFTGGDVRVRGWHFLFLKMKEGALLPNLHTLKARVPFEYSQFDRLAWFALFLSPSLRVLDLDNGYYEQWIKPRLPMNSVSLLLAALSESLPAHSKNYLSIRYRCPSEHALASVCPTEYQEGYYWFNNIPNLTHLRELGITVFPDPEPTRDALCVIAHLPLLEQLTLYFVVNYEREREGGYDFNHTLPCSPKLFPSLRSLNLERVPNARMFRWIWGLKPLVSGVSLARIDRDFSSNPEEFDANIIQPMREGSPSPSNLSISVSGLRHMGALEIACELMSRMPLKVLEIHGVAGWGPYPAIYQASTFSHLRRLSFWTPLVPEQWRVLTNLAKALPNLEYLFIWPLIRALKPWGLDSTDVEHPALQPIHMEIEVFVLENRTREERENHTRPLLKCLRTIWPNASFLVGGIATPIRV
ncbi:hypothetical protein RSAG8_12084, partial [Rhizoctonia solani AG-8 WAC10335]